MENVGVPGSILVTGQVSEEVKGNPAIGLQPLGSHKLKNVSGKVGIYAVESDGLVVPKQRDITSKLAKGNRPKWVLPSAAATILALILLSFWFGYG